METLNIKYKILNTLNTKSYLEYYDLFSTLQYRLVDDHNFNRVNGTFDDLIIETLTFIDGALVQDEMSKFFKKFDKETLIDLFLSFYEYKKQNERVFSKSKSVFWSKNKYNSINYCSISDFKILCNPFMAGYNVFIKGLISNNEFSLENQSTYKSRVEVHDHGIYHLIAELENEANQINIEFQNGDTSEDIILYGSLYYDEALKINAINVLKPILTINRL